MVFRAGATKANSSFGGMDNASCLRFKFKNENKNITRQEAANAF